MMEKNIVQRIKADLEAKKAEEVNLNRKYKHTWHSGMGTFALLEDLERARKRRVELEDALRILEEFK